MDITKQNLRVREKMGYGFGDLASVLYWQTFTAYLLYFYTDVFGITAAAAGTMFLLTRLWDGVNDPMMGMIADRTNTRWGKFRPYLIWMAIPMAILGVITFTTPDLAYNGKLIYAYITFTFIMMAYTAINIPYSSLLGVITSNPMERASVSSYKYVFAYISGSVISFFALPMVAGLGKGNEQKGWQLFMIFVGIAAIIFFLITFLSTKERVKPLKTQKTSISKDLKDLFSNKPWVLLLFTTLFMILFVATRISVTPHYFKYYVVEQTINFISFQDLKLFFLEGHKLILHEIRLGFIELTSAFNGIGQICAIIGVLFTKKFAELIGGKKKAFLILFIIAVVATSSLYILKPNNLFMIYFLQVIGSLTGGPLTPLIWAMYADTADYSEWKNSRRATGLVFSASTMSQKFGWALGAFIAGVLLSVFGFKANEIQNADVQTGLRALMSIIPGVAGVVSIVLILFYKLDEKTMIDIETELLARRKDAGEQIEE